MLTTILIATAVTAVVLMLAHLVVVLHRDSQKRYAMFCEQNQPAWDRIEAERVRRLQQEWQAIQDRVNGR